MKKTLCNPATYLDSMHRLFLQCLFWNKVKIENSPQACCLHRTPSKLGLNTTTYMQSVIIITLAQKNCYPALAFVNDPYCNVDNHVLQTINTVNAILACLFCLLAGEASPDIHPSADNGPQAVEDAVVHYFVHLVSILKGREDSLSQEQTVGGLCPRRKHKLKVCKKY